MADREFTRLMGALPLFNSNAESMPPSDIDLARHASPLQQHSPGPSKTDANPRGRESIDEYVVYRIIDHRLNPNDTVSYRIRWYGYGPSGDTWDPPAYLPHHFVARYYDLETAQLLRNRAAHRQEQAIRGATRQQDETEAPQRKSQMTHAPAPQLLREHVGKSKATQLLKFTWRCADLGYLYDLDYLDFVIWSI